MSSTPSNQHGSYLNTIFVASRNCPPEMNPGCLLVYPKPLRPPNHCPAWPQFTVALFCSSSAGAVQGFPINRDQEFRLGRLSASRLPPAACRLPPAASRLRSQVSGLRSPASGLPFIFPSAPTARPMPARGIAPGIHHPHTPSPEGAAQTRRQGMDSPRNIDIGLLNSPEAPISSKHNQHSNLINRQSQPEGRRIPIRRCP